ncbi:oxidoreductase [Actinokineospora sp. NBRC 105648]|uniref:WD40/YVTN/BNR-like repeat-containing protein n=1 Tax=Actinokineospora sp. NBRC 105648 TaxID=3032206 RepID=UPI0024A56E32|nr:oxidoreductase [Actinokineospora sp. NBRC 105648]GLZ39566.1 oxidoreductase [Actinokineospora sp. NBRC 105648]
MKRSLITAALAAVAVATLQAPASADAPAPTWKLSTTGTDAQLRGLSAVSHRVAWASGSKGTVLRTVDGGRTWTRTSPPDTAALELRDIEAFDANTAVAMTIGPGGQSRIFRTTDGGKAWTETFRNAEETAFYDCLAFFDREHGLALSDPVGGKFRLVSTQDGGRSWSVVPGDRMPAALDGEFAFAASGQCVSTSGSRDAWIATGGGAKARVLHSADRGRSWTVTDTVLASAPSAGVFATAFRDTRHGIAVGGDYATPTGGVDALGLTRDGGKTWQKPSNAPQGYRSGVAWHPFLRSAAIAVGPTGSDYTLDEGRHWRRFDTGSFDTVDCAADGACWAAGEKGRVAVLGFTR